ncbi:hypothetical protein Tco_0672893 [Tanacetum coccineum]
MSDLQVLEKVRAVAYKLELSARAEQGSQKKTPFHVSNLKRCYSDDPLTDTLPILLSFTHCGNKTILRVLRIILVILPEHPSETKVFHNEDGNPARANIKQALGSYERSHKGVKASANSDIVYFFTSAQDGDPLQDDVRLCLADDLKKAQDHNQRQVMAISIISVSSDSSEESMGTSTGRVILFGTIPTTIPDTTPSVMNFTKQEER